MNACYAHLINAVENVIMRTDHGESVIVSHVDAWATSKCFACDLFGIYEVE